MTIFSRHQQKLRFLVALLLLFTTAKTTDDTNLSDLCKNVCPSPNAQPLYAHECKRICLSLMVDLIFTKRPPTETAGPFNAVNSQFLVDPDPSNDIDAFAELQNALPIENVREEQQTEPGVDKRSSSFVRIGKSGYYPADRVGLGLVPTSLNPHSVEDESREMFKRFRRLGDVMGLLGNAYSPKRTSSFVRIGKKSTYMPDYEDLMNPKRSSSFVRIGRSLDGLVWNDRKKRSLQNLQQVYESSEKGVTFPHNDGLSESLLEHRLDLQTKLTDKSVEDNESASKDYGKKGHETSRNKRSTDGKTILDSSITRDERASSFVRIGRDQNREWNALENTGVLRKINADVSPNEGEIIHTIGKGYKLENSNTNDKRASSFVRIGKSTVSGYEEAFHKNNDAQKLLSQDSDYENQSHKRASSFVRIGKSSYNEPPHPSRYENKHGVSSFIPAVDDVEDVKEKRPGGFVRIGKSMVWYDTLAQEPTDDKRAQTSSFVRVGKALPLEYNANKKKASSFVRIGKSFAPQSLPKRGQSSFVRVGKAEGTWANHYFPFEKKASSFVRIGKSPEYAVDPCDDINGCGMNGDLDLKRDSGFVRIGRGGVSNEDKKATSFVRIGRSVKQPSNYFEAKHQTKS